MPRSLWKGTIAFGLVNIPVSLVAAESKPDVQLHMVDSKNHARIRYERVNADTGEEVPWDRMVKGYEYEEGKFILLDEKELEAIQPELTKTIEITEFVKLDEIDPLLFEKPYYLEPDKRGRRAYALLREALRASGKAGISRLVIRTREYLAALLVRDDALVVMLLRFPQELRSAATLDLPSAKDSEGKPAKRELDLAKRLIDDMTEKWKPADFQDEYRAALMEHIEQKIQGGETIADVKDSSGDEESTDGNVVDLAEYLRRSVADRKPAMKKSAKNAPKKSAKTPAKKSVKKPARKTSKRSA